MKNLILILTAVMLFACTQNPVSEAPALEPDQDTTIMAPEVLELHTGDLACLIVGRMTDTVTLELDLLAGHRKAKVAYPDGSSDIVEAGNLYPLEWCE